MGKQGLATHKSVVHDLHEYENDDLKKNCDQCGKTFQSSSDFEKHWHEEHTLEEKLANIKAFCHNCNNEFKTASDLNFHLTKCISNNVKYLKCDNCKSKNLSEEEFSWHSTNALRKHFAESHNLVKYICEICGQNVDFKYQLEDHRKKFHEEVPSFVCNYCGKVLATKTTLNGHIGRMHEMTAKKYKCKQCDFSCIERYRLKAHVEAVHKKNVKYSCDQCKYSSYRKGGLQTHVKMVHEKHRPHQCDVCDMTFIYRRDKLKHMTIKHGVLPETIH